MKKLFAAAALSGAAAGAALCCENNALQVTHYSVEAKLRRPIRLLVISDLHGKQFGKDNTALIKRIRLLRPDLIVFPGDSVSSSLYNLEATLMLFRRLSDLCPCFLIPGNHEKRSGKWGRLSNQIKSTGITVLQNERADTVIQGQKLHILGLDEGLALSRLDYLRAACGTLKHPDNRHLLKELASLDGVRIVLSHFPENYALIGELSYCRFPFDLMVCGHAHGGHMRLFGKPVYSPGQGFMPRFADGLYGKAPALLVSRGLGNDSPIPRINNRPELPLVIIR